MPFSLSHAHTTFIQTMNYVFIQYIRIIVTVSFNDIFIFNRNIEERLEHLKQMFKTLRVERLHINIEKSVFCK